MGHRRTFPQSHRNDPTHAARLRRRRLAVLLAGPALAIAAVPGTVAAAEDSFEKALELIRMENAMLPGLAMMERMSRAGVFTPAAYMQFLAMTGDADAVEASNEAPSPGVGPDAPTDVCSYKAENALAAILAESRERKIVMINEAHHEQRHRAFASLLLRGLRDAGFTHFGAESFAPEIHESMADGAPDGMTGVYTADPYFADLVRQAKQLGFQFFDYEQRPHQQTDATDRASRIAVREQAQAANIKAVMDRNPEARFVIFAGYSHIREWPTSDGSRWMAYRLRHLTGVDPLSIDQIPGTPRHGRKTQSPWYSGIERCHDIRRPLVLADEGRWLGGPGTDIAVVHPRTPGDHDWRLMDGYRQATGVRFEESPSRSLLRAFVATEPADAIPMDQILLEPGATTAALHLPSGEFRLVRQFEDGRNESLPDILTVTSRPAGDKSPR